MIAFVFSILLLADAPPMTDDQHARLAGAVDGRDHREDAFAALVENVRGWSAGAGEEPIRLKWDFAALLNEPVEFRGAMFRISGVIQQRSPLAPPYEAMSEWFVRDDMQRPMIVYVPQATTDHSEQSPDDGERIEIDGRFYKRVDAVANDGKVHSYPAFVGAFPRVIDKALPVPGSGSQPMSVWMLSGPIVALLVVFVALVIYIRRRPAVQRPRMTRTIGFEVRDEDEPPGLPTDPAQALAELKRRAQDRQSQ